MSIESDPGQVDEEPAVDFPDVDDALPPAERDVKSLDRVPREPQLARETVARASRNDAEGRARPSYGARDLVHRAVTAPCAHEVNPGGHGSPGQIEGVARPLGEAHRPLDPVRGKHPFDEGLPRSAGAGPPRPGDRVDNDDDRGRQMRSKPRISSQSVTVWSNVRCSSRAVCR